MEGSYMTLAQRQKLANEISKTNINLTSGKGEYATTSYSFFQPRHSQNSVPDTSYIKDIKASHFRIGDGATYRSQSEFSARYPHHTSPVAARKTQKEIQEIRRHSVTLGNHKDSYATTSTVAFPANSATVNPKVLQEVKQQMNNLRKHNFKFGDDPNTLNSVFKHEFPNNQGVNIERVKQTQLKDELAKSHFVVGNSPMYYQTTTTREFNVKSYEDSSVNAQFKKEFTKEHFVLGDNQPLMATTSKGAYTYKEGGRQDLNKETLNSLKSSHFTLGNEKISYAPASRINSCKEPRAISTPISSSLALRKTNFVLGNDEAVWTTMYQNAQNSPQNVSRSIPRDSNADRRSTLILGTEGNIPISTNNSLYRPLGSEGPGKLDPKLAKELRGHHFQIGNDNKFYSTTNSFYGLGKGEPSRMDPNLRKELRNSHFIYGNEPVPKISIVQKDFKPITSVPNPADKLLAKNLRSSHFSIGDDKGMWSSTYKGNFIGVNPVPEKDWQNPK